LSAFLAHRGIWQRPGRAVRLFASVAFDKSANLCRGVGHFVISVPFKPIEVSGKDLAGPSGRLPPSHLKFYFFTIFNFQETQGNIAHDYLFNSQKHSKTILKYTSN
jgi:hypothetical protein